MEIQGLENRGNQCYQNSVLQLLMALATFRQFVLDNRPNGPLSEALQSFMRSYRADGMRVFHNNEQHDAHEYLTLLLDQLNEESEKRLCPLFFSHQVMTRIVNENDAEDVKNSFSTETILVVPYSSSLELSISQSQEGSVLEDWESEIYRQKCRATQSYVISLWPVHLFIMIQRGMTSHSKIIGTMNIPETLYDYRVRGCIVHFGTPHFGHYVAVVCRDKKWFLCDDLMIRPIGPHEVAKYLSQAYLLLYSRD